MRTLVIAMLVACGKPAPPDPKAYAAMTDEQKCEATAPRGRQCAEEIVEATAQMLLDQDPTMKDFSDEVKRELEAQPRASKKDREEMHKVECVSDARYTDAV